MSQADSPAYRNDRPSGGALLAEQMSEAAGRRERQRDLKPLMRLWPFALRHRLDLVMSLAFLLLATVASLGLTATARGAIDHGFANDGQDINRWFLWLGLNALGLAAVTAGRYFYVTKTGERMVADLRQAVFGHVLSLDQGFLAGIRTGEVLSRLTTDIQIVDTLLTTSISYALRNVLMLVGSVIMLAAVSLKLTGLVLLIVPLLIGPLFFYGRRVRALTVQSQDRFADAVGFAGESIEALETVQAFGREQAASIRFGAAVDGAFAASLKRVRARAVMTAAIILAMFGGVTLVLWLGARDVIDGRMSEGALIQFVLLAVFAAGAVAALGESWGDVQKASGAMARIGDLMQAEPEVAAPPAPAVLPSPPRGEAALDKVSFAYPGRPELTALKDFSLAVNPGETVALVGPSGAGKSTVFRLLLRFYDPDQGRVLVDGVDIRDADPAEVRSRLAWVSQEAPLFSGSGADNVRFGRADADDAAVRTALGEAQALKFLEALPRGLDEPLGERGRSLSGGQRQRLAIARALVRHAPILLLDEATSALDAENERLVQLALDRAMEARTTLVIAHRLATVKRADRIVVMDEGRVVEQGTHAALVRKGGLYARLAELQFRAE